MTSLINASSPLVWDATMLAAAEVYAAANQATIITPFILAGAMAPATSAGVAAQTLAESLAGMAFTQLVRPGAPVIFGSFASSMSMQTGAPDVRHARAGDRAVHGGGPGAPARCAVPVGRLAVRVEAPRCAGRLRVGGDAAADDPRRRQLRAPRRRLARGWAGDRLREVRARLRPARHDGDVREGARPVRQRAGARRHPSSTSPASTSSARRTRSPTSRPPSTARSTADNSSFEQWLEEGSLDAAQRANKVWKEQLASYEPPPIDDAIDEELREYVARRKAVLPGQLRVMPRILWQHTRRPSSSFLPQKQDPDSAAAIRTTVVVMSATKFEGAVA